MHEHDAPVTRAFVLHPAIRSEAGAREPVAALEEAVSLAAALPGLEVAGAEIVRLQKAQPGRLFGSGKIEEIGHRLKAEEIELVLIDGPVTPVQQRNLERDWKVKILDRTGLILEIFSDRARTREGVLQVEMAALSYQRTRLVRAWTHLERQRGGLGFVGGPGETQIEADRRAIDEQLVRLRRQLDKVVKTRELHRRSRKKVPYPVVALVGYTNAGKSTLFNRLTGAEVMAKDMLFATLDPTMRRLPLPEGPEVILSDTVGFVSDLPTELVAAFRATLEEVIDADLILHVRDISHPQSDEQSRDVTTILASLGLGDEAPIIEVLNKIDRLAPEDRAATLDLAAHRPDRIALSAVTGQGVEALLALIAERLTPKRERGVVRLTWADGRLLAWLQAREVVRDVREDADGWTVAVEWSGEEAARFAAERGRSAD